VERAGEPVVAIAELGATGLEATVLEPCERARCGEAVHREAGHLLRYRDDQKAEDEHRNRYHRRVHANGEAHAEDYVLALRVVYAGGQRPSGEEG
jgi:hypothetical protein